MADLQLQPICLNLEANPMQHGSALMNEKGSTKPVDALSRSQGHVELVVITVLQDPSQSDE